VTPSMMPNVCLPLPVPSRRFARLFTTDIPNVENPVWDIETRALHDQIVAQGGAMTIDDIVAWGLGRGDSGSVIRHKLAWLSIRNLVRYDNENKTWRCS